MQVQQKMQRIMAEIMISEIATFYRFLEQINNSVRTYMYMYMIVHNWCTSQREKNSVSGWELREFKGFKIDGEGK